MSQVWRRRRAPPVETVACPECDEPAFHVYGAMWQCSQCRVSFIHEAKEARSVQRQK